MKNIHEYLCHDLYIASVLLASKKLELQKLEKTGEKHIVFVFSDPNSLAQTIIASYLSRKYNINSLDFVEAIKQLKNRIYLGI